MNVLRFLQFGIVFKFFNRLSYGWIPACFLCIIGYIWVFFYAPFEENQGAMVLILYLHVPSAWLAVMYYSLLGVCSIGYLSFRIPSLFFIAKSCCYVGIFYTLVCLMTGMLWGRPIWGTWWVWDARLTSVLLLFFLYIGYFLIAAQRVYSAGLAKMVSYIAIVGLVNVPIIKWSVEWWSTLHQPPSVSLLNFKVTMPLQMLWPLMLCFLGHVFFSLSFLAKTFQFYFLMAKEEKNAL